MNTNKKATNVLEDVKINVKMAIPSVMVLLSLVLNAKANRLVNIIIGIVSIVVLGATFFAGDVSSRYTFQAIVEGVLIGSIIWLAWKWPKQEPRVLIE